MISDDIVDVFITKTDRIYEEIFEQREVVLSESSSLFSKWIIEQSYLYENAPDMWRKQKSSEAINILNSEA